MAISGLGSGLYGYSTIDRTVKAAENVTPLQPENTVDNNLLQQERPETSEEKAPKVVTQDQLEDFVFSFKNNKEFSMTGEDSDINSLDITGQVSDTSKDFLLDQYKFFVNGDNAKQDNGVWFSSPEGSVKRVVR